MAIKFAKIIQTTSDRIGVIIKGLTSFSRSEAQDPCIAYPLTDIISDTLVLCVDRFQMHGIDFRASEPTRGLLIWGRPVQLEQVLLNLLNNAHDAVEGLPAKWIQQMHAD